MQNVLPTFQRAVETDRQIINLIRFDYTLILYVVGALIHLPPPLAPSPSLPSVPATLPLSLASCNKNSCCCCYCYCGCCCCWWQRATAAQLPLSDARAAAHQMQRADAAVNDVAAAARITTMLASKSQCCCLAPALPANSWQGTNTHAHIHIYTTYNQAANKHEARHDELCRCRCCSRDANQ